MTRKEYLEHRKDYDEKQLSGGAFILLTQCYIDDFESRTCENCKYSSFDILDEYGDCSKGFGWYWNSHMEISRDFGCVRFERKESE